MTKETGIIELETLVPLFIKDKDPEYGEGVYPLGDKIYLLDNDKLCEFLYERTYDAEGNLREQGKDYVDEYSKILNQNYRSDDLRGRSIKSFLETTELISRNSQDAEPVVRAMAKGVMSMADVRRGKKFIVNGLGTPYIPGSSIRGAFRNALLWTMLTTDPALKTVFDSFFQSRIRGLNATLDEINQKRGLSWDEKRRLIKKKKEDVVEKFCIPPRECGLGLNAQTFSRLDPKFQGSHGYGEGYVRDYNVHWSSATEMHKDLFRIVKISDAAFIGSVQTEALTVETYKQESGAGSYVFTPKENTYITLNGFPENVKARFRITIDKALAAEIFSGTIPSYLNSVPALLKAVNSFFRTVADEEQKFFSSALHSPNVRAVQDWYKPYKMQSERSVVESPLLFRVGWGGGMMSKTQFLHLSDPDRKTIRNLITDRGCAVAPKSRCLHVNNHEAQTPLGWCILRYIGVDTEEFFHPKTSRVPAVQHASRPQNHVKAIIVDAKSSPAKIKVKEGQYNNVETVMPKTLQCLQLTQDSEVLVTLVVSNGKLQKAEFWGRV
jgi:CRISPR type III-A-associated RAMP protein Csm5